MTLRLLYRQPEGYVRDRTGWGPGPWSGEVDKYQWLHEETALPALVVRSHSGALCGYIGVGPKHPWWQVGYGACTKQCEPDPTDDDTAFDGLLGPEVAAKLREGLQYFRNLRVQNGTDHWTHCEHTPEALLEVHGGITYSGHGDTDTREERWVEWCEALRAIRPEVDRYPNGDAAARWREASKYLSSYPGWVGWMTATTIGSALPTEERHWWFGFDCAHAGDLAPDMEATLRRIRTTVPDFPRDPRYRDVYRDLPYVMGQLEVLAKQLWAVAEVEEPVRVGRRFHRGDGLV